MKNKKYKKNIKHKIAKKIIIYGIAIGYLFLPLDIIPDMPFVGLIDDVAVLILSYFIAEGEK